MIDHISKLTSTISKIDPQKKNSWYEKYFLTFDIDWAHDEVIRYTYKLISEACVSSTWFVTHQTECISEMAQDPLLELGVHPNFNPLLQGDHRFDSKKVMERIMEIVPNAHSIRSHSLLQSERLIDLFASQGLSHISNFFLPFNNIKPYYLWNNMVAIPHHFQDNVLLRKDFSYSEDIFLDCSLRVYNFHPIHVFLNSESMERYEAARPYFDDPAKLEELRFDGYGTRNRLVDLLTRCS